MKNDEAIRLLHPSTTGDAIREIEYYNGFNGKIAAIKAIEEASIIACTAMEEQDKLKEWITNYKLGADFLMTRDEVVKLLEEFINE